MTIRVLGDMVLRRKAKRVNRPSAAEKKLLDDMVEVMVEAEGAGLAAPQVGASKRLIVARVSDGEILQMVNPSITSRSEETEIGVEGCLSIPGFQADVERSCAIHLQGLDRDGNEVEYQLQDYPARVVQHEVDHLDGKLYIDRCIAETLSRISVEEDPETGEELCVLTPVTLEELRATFSNPGAIPKRVKPIRREPALTPAHENEGLD